MNVKRCQSIAGNIADKLIAIRSELAGNYQSADYLLSKLIPLIHDANVLKTEFEYLQKEQEIKKGE